MAENTRRNFMKQTAMSTAAALAYPSAFVLGANDRVRVGMIGAGARGQDLLKQALEVPGIQLVAVADVYTRRCEQARQLIPQVQAFEDHRRLLDMKDLDAVIVASPLHLHALHFLDTLAAGKDLYAEKTMTWSIPEAEQCLAAAERSDRVVQIGLQHESSGALADARQWIKAGLAGKITQVESWMSRNTPHGNGQWVREVPPDCTPQNVNWKAFLNGRPDREFDAYKFINWRLFWEFSGGNVTENMVHQMAWIMSALDLPEPIAACMSGGIFSEKDGRQVPDTIAVTFEFPADVVVTWQSTFSNSLYGLGERLLGNDGTIEHIAGATGIREELAVVLFVKCHADFPKKRDRLTNAEPPRDVADNGRTSSPEIALRHDSVRDVAPSPAAHENFRAELLGAVEHRDRLVRVESPGEDGRRQARRATADNGDVVRRRGG